MSEENAVNVSTKEEGNDITTTTYEIAETEVTTTECTLTEQTVTSETVESETSVQTTVTETTDGNAIAESVDTETTTTEGNSSEADKKPEKSEVCETVDDASKSGESSGKNTATKKKPLPISVIDDKAIALYAHNAVRKLHGVPELEWDDNLAEEAKAWAMHLAENDSKLEHDLPVDGFGENLYMSKGSSTPAKSYQAVLLWYKGILQYKYNMPGYSSNTAAATQLLWDETTHVGVAVVYREDTLTTYIVARYSPPGNERHSESYTEHVKPPLKGLPPKMPRMEDLIQTDNTAENLSNMGTLFDVLCHWCKCDGEKPTEESSGVQPKPGSRKNNKSVDNQDESKTKGGGEENTK